MLLGSRSSTHCQSNAKNAAMKKTVQLQLGVVVVEGVLLKKKTKCSCLHCQPSNGLVVMQISKMWWTGLNTTMLGARTAQG